MIAITLNFFYFQSDNMTIVISELTLEEDSPPMLDDNVKHLFVEYHLNGVDPVETETPFSLPKPKPFQAIPYNFSKSKFFKSRPV